MEKIEIVRVYRDGVEICARLGSQMPNHLAAGFGNTVGDALRDLAEEIDVLGLELDLEHDPSQEPDE